MPGKRKKQKKTETSENLTDSRSSDQGAGTGLKEEPYDEDGNVKYKEYSASERITHQGEEQPAPQQPRQTNHQVASADANITLAASKETYRLIEEYLNQIKQYGMEALVRDGKMGKRLYTVLSTSHIQKLTTVEFIDALLKTTNPVAFAEDLTQVKGDGSDWTKDEISLLGRMTRVVKNVTVYSKNTYDPEDDDVLKEDERPKVTLLYANGALLGGCRADLSRVTRPTKDETGKVENKFDETKYRKFLEENLLPTLLFANNDAGAEGAVVTLPVLGGGLFSGAYAKEIEKCYANLVYQLLHVHREQLGNIKGVVITGLGKNDTKKNIGSMALHTTSIYAKGVGLYPREINKSFEGYKTYTVIAGDPTSFPANDSIKGSNRTHDGGVSAVTNVNEIVSGLKGFFGKLKKIFQPNYKSETLEFGDTTYFDVYKDTQRTLTFDQVEIYDHTQGKREVLALNRSENYNPQYLGVTNPSKPGKNGAGPLAKQTALDQQKKRTVALIDVDALIVNGQYNDALIQSLLQQNIKDIYLSTTNADMTDDNLKEYKKLIAHLKPNLTVHELISPNDLKVEEVQQGGSLDENTKSKLIKAQFTGIPPIGAVFKAIRDESPKDKGQVADWFSGQEAISDPSGKMLSLLSKHKPEWVNDFIVLGKSRKDLAVTDYNDLITSKKKEIETENKRPILDKLQSAAENKKHKDIERFSIITDIMSDIQNKYDESGFISKPAVSFDTAVNNQITTYLSSDNKSDAAFIIQGIQTQIDNLHPNRVDFFFNSPREKVAAFKMLQKHLVLFDLGFAQEKTISHVIENWLNSGSFTKTKENNNDLHTVREILGTQRYTFTQGKQGDTSSLNYVYNLLKETRKEEQKQEEKLTFDR